MSKKVLIVGIGNSVHTERWVNMISDCGFEVYLFNSYFILNNASNIKYSKKIKLLNFKSESSKLFKVCLKHPIKAISKLKTLNLEYLKIYLSSELYDENLKQLARAIKKYDFDLIHTLNTQASGNLLYDTISRYNLTINKWCNTVWGSDLYLHQWISDSRVHLLEIMPRLDFYWGEGYRDYDLAKSLGFKGEFLPPLPAFGGFNLKKLDSISRIKPSERKLILVKGYQNVVGRADITFHALERCSDLLRGFEIVIISAENGIIKTIGEIFSNKYDIPVKSVSGVSNDEIARLHSNSRISIALSTSDGLPSFFAESLAYGDFPIQSNTSMCDEWVTNGENAFLVEPDDTMGIASVLRIALTDDQLVDDAAIMNLQIIKEKMNIEALTDQAKNSYKYMLGE